MTNIIYLIGRLHVKPEFVKIGRKKIFTIHVKVVRPYKNKDGFYEEDVFYVEVPFVNVNKYDKYMNQGDLVGIKGHLEIHEDKCVVICEKLSFLARKDKNDDE